MFQRKKCKNILLKKRGNVWHHVHGVQVCWDLFAHFSDGIFYPASAVQRAVCYFGTIFAYTLGEGGRVNSPEGCYKLLYNLSDAELYGTKFSIISLYLTKLYVTYRALQ